MEQVIFLGGIFALGAACRDIAVNYCNAKKDKARKERIAAVRNAVSNEKKRRDMYEAMDWGWDK